MDLVTTVRSRVNPALVNRLSMVLGLPHGPVARGIEAAVPAVLAGVASSVSDGRGIARLQKVFATLDPALSRTYPALVTSSAHESVVSSGHHALSAVIGAPAATALNTAIGRYTGLAASQAGALVGAITPLVLSQLNGVARQRTLSGEALARLLTEQAQPLAAAMPNDFARLYRPHASARATSVAPLMATTSGAALAPAIAANAPPVESVRPQTATATTTVPDKISVSVLLRATAATLVALAIGAAIVWRYLASGG